MPIRILSVFCSLTLLFGLVLYLFWHQEGQYLLPTPVPESYQAVLAGQTVDIRQAGLALKGEGQVSAKPFMLHFYNPDCPCSRFNMDHFQALVHRYKGQITFCVVLQAAQPQEAIKRFRQQYGVSIAVIVDQDKRLAKACGVYSTPQAALLDSAGTLYYRGNYNRTRYCTDPRSNFAQMALDSLLAHRPLPQFVALATNSYGCSLPSVAGQAVQFYP